MALPGWQVDTFFVVHLNAVAGDSCEMRVDWHCEREEGSPGGSPYPLSVLYT